MSPNNSSTHQGWATIQRESCAHSYLVHCPASLSSTPVGPYQGRRSSSFFNRCRHDFRRSSGAPKSSTSRGLGPTCFITFFIWGLWPRGLSCLQAVRRALSAGIVMSRWGTGKAPRTSKTPLSTRLPASTSATCRRLWLRPNRLQPPQCVTSLSATPCPLDPARGIS